MTVMAPQAPVLSKKIFISYSWDNDLHKEWVLQLANHLIQNGLDVILDQYDLGLGKNLTHFMEKLDTADKVIVIFTSNYKLKAEGRLGGVGYEYSIINHTLYKNQLNNNKIIPVLREGTPESSIPVFMNAYVWLDMCNDDDFDKDFETLLRDIYGEPFLKKPLIGPQPFFHSVINEQLTELSGQEASFFNYPWQERSPYFTETFDLENTASKIFCNYKDDNWTGQREDGTYKLTNITDENAVKYHFFQVNKQVMPYFATSVEVKMVDTVGSNACCGLQFCYDEATKCYYSFCINNNGQYNLWLKKQDGYKPIISERSEFIIRSEFNKIAFIKLNDNIYLYINNQFVKKVTESSLEKGHTGIIAFSTGTFLFDNLSLFKL